jgi:ABC-2 type transport system permease protein
MRSFKAYFKKEAIEAIRTNKYLILAIGTVFWALLNPLMLKLMPVIMKKYIPPEISEIFSYFTRDSAFQNFLGDFFEMGTLFIVFSLMGLISNEVYGKKLIFPYSRGVDPTGIVLAKYIHYAITISTLILIAFLTNYFYINNLFDGGILSIGIVLRSALLYIFYYCILLSIIIFLSSIFRRSLIAGISSLVLAYGLSIFNQFKTIRVYLPNYLLFKATNILIVFDRSLIVTSVVSFCIIILLIFLTVYRMKKIDIV